MQKRFFFLLLFLLVFVGVALSQVFFEKLRFDQALQKARRESKTIFIYFYTDWCAPCKQLDTIVFTEPEIRDLLNTHHVNLKVNAEKGDGIKLNKKYNTDGYPTFVFIDTTGALLGEIHGTRSNEGYFIAIQSLGREDPEGRELKELLKKRTEKKK